MKRGFTPGGGRPGSLGSAAVTASPTSTSTPRASGTGSPITTSAGERTETAASTAASAAE